MNATGWKTEKLDRNIIRQFLAGMFSTAAKVGKVRNANLLYVVDGGQLSFVHYEIIPAANGKAWVSYKVENRPEPDGSWKSYKWVRDREPCL